ncbi:hypothetical protein BOX15_Mlig008689g1 [Macrostomum lignano]|uniref:SCP domain-containing protein n=2 Tax=Macrostomum lignano TaxID=282301 RepID=A0A1I8GSB3_9PLAT|nr:hypothetical protein BOX15_Mlig008689g1 [Macrostomum lignano]
MALYFDRLVCLSLLLLLVSISHTEGELVALSKADKQIILDTHNVLRARTARGETGSQPSAADMMLLEWDDRLMEKAANWASQCKVGHDTPAERVIPGHKWVGQNWAGGHSTNLSLFVDLWYVEHNDYNFAAKTCTPEKMCGHYTQVVWSRTLLVGCAAATCPGYLRILVCDYADGGNVGTYPAYESGSPASKCVGEYTYTSGGLCLRRDQCAAMYTGGGRIGGGVDGGGGTGGADPGSAPSPTTKTATTTSAATTTTFDPWDGWTFDDGYEYLHGEEAKTKRSRVRRGTDGGCRCAIQCLNGGTLDSANCKCSCTPDYYGTRCEMTCSDPEMFRSNCESDPDACKTFPMFCPKTCNGCKAGDIRDKAVVNADGVLARLP